MEQRKRKYPTQVRERAVQLVLNKEKRLGSQRAAVSAVAEEVGCAPKTLEKWVREAEIATVRNSRPSTPEKDRVAELQSEIRRLKRLNRKLTKALERRSGSMQYAVQGVFRIDFIAAPGYPQTAPFFESRILHVNANTEAEAKRKAHAHFKRDSWSAKNIAPNVAKNEQKYKGIAQVKDFGSSFEPGEVWYEYFDSISHLPELESPPKLRTTKTATPKRRRRTRTP